MQSTPKSLRLHIGIFGRRNVGKSSLLNALTRQEISIVSEVAGTTTDPVEKAMEMLPVGPVLFIDTAGIDDEGALGEMRIGKTVRVFDRTDLAIVVGASGEWGEFENRLVGEFSIRKVPTIVVFNKSDLGTPDPSLKLHLEGKGIRTVLTCAPSRAGLLDLREAIIRSAPEDFINQPTIVGDLVPAGEMAVLVIPIDLEAPKGRLIVPQVQTIRDLLDNDSYCMVVKERELAEALARLTRPPKIVITDSQAFLRVAGDAPESILLTSFSILFARLKGDLTEMVRGACAIDKLRPGSRVLVCEACTHHPIGDDIGRVKIPRWLMQYVGGELIFDQISGHDFPSDVSKYNLVVHCGACVHNRREVLTRIAVCRHQGVPITNYGLAIAFSLGIFERALRPFPAALDAYKAAIAQRRK
ncbi:MAG: [FeFe] hydrogenase H-cluster maturation GTPase HydF [Candidatus Brocadiia bacterium]